MNKSSSKTIRIEGATDICTALHHNVFGLMISSQHTLAQSTSAPSMRRQLSSWPPAGATWTAYSPCCRLGLSLTSPTRPEKLPSTKVRSRASRIMSSTRTELTVLAPPRSPQAQNHNAWRRPQSNHQPITNIPLNHVSKMWQNMAKSPGIFHQGNPALLSHGFTQQEDKGRQFLVFVNRSHILFCSQKILTFPTLRSSVH